MSGGIAGNYFDSIIIQNDGTVTYNSSYSNEEIPSIQLSEEELEILKKLIINSNVFELEDSYWCEKNCPADMFMTSIDLEIDGKKITIISYYPDETPEDLSNLIDALQSIATNFP